MLFYIRPLDGILEQNKWFFFLFKRRGKLFFFFLCPVICLLTLLSDVYLLACPLENLFLSFLFDATAESLITRHPRSSVQLIISWKMHSTAETLVESRHTMRARDDEPLITPLKSIENINFMYS